MPACSAFTLIELLVVIAVIGLLIAAIAVSGSRIMYSQKVKHSQTIMKAVSQAVEQFAEENPLRSIYDRKDARTFGAFPPYQLQRPSAQQNSVWWVLEPGHPLMPGVGQVPGTLAERVARDLSGMQTPNLSSWVQFANDPSGSDDDIRALYTYLKVYSPGTLAQVPPDRIKPLTPTPEFVNPKGAGTTPGRDGVLDVFGIYDAWDVPLDYFLYVKIEWGPPPPGASGTGQWRVTDRIPVLRSRGITLEEYKAEAAGTDPLDPQKWIFSAAFPSPPAQQGGQAFRDTGVMTATGTQYNGWARARAVGDDYKYLPEPGEATGGGP